MKQYKRILVCVDWPMQDLRMLAYVAGRARLAEAREVHFLHVTTAPPEAGDETTAEAPAPPDDTLAALEALVIEHFKGHGQEQVFCHVLQGATLMEILRFAHEKDIDLILLGRHLGRAGEADDEALLARRVSRKATCSVLVLPEDSPPEAEMIIVPVRDSKCSSNALDVACGVAAVTGASVTALNIFRVAAGYSRVGTTLEEHEALLEAAAQRECDRLLKRTDAHGVDVTSKCVPDLHGNPVPIILEMVSGGPPSAVVIGARGRTGAAGVLLGTVTEQLIRKCPVPVLAVKKKGECLGIVQALLALAGQG